MYVQKGLGISLKLSQRGANLEADPPLMRSRVPGHALDMCSMCVDDVPSRTAPDCIDSDTPPCCIGAEGNDYSTDENRQPIACRLYLPRAALSAELRGGLLHQHLSRPGTGRALVRAGRASAVRTPGLRDPTIARLLVYSTPHGTWGDCAGKDSELVL